MMHKTLQLLRKYHALPRKDLAQLLCISTYHLENIEKGYRIANKRHLEWYSRIFGLPENDIVVMSGLLKDPFRMRQLKNVSDKLKRIANWLVDTSGTRD